MNTQELYFVTGNCGKFGEVQRFFTRYVPTFSLHHADLDVPEIQSLDLKFVAIEKAKSAWEQLKKPLIIDDGGFFLDAYNNFPGALSKFVVEGIGIEGIFTLAAHNRKGYFRNYVVYIDSSDSPHLFEGICTGELVKPETYTMDKILPFRSFFKPHGSDKTYAELKGSPEEHQIHHRIKAVKKLAQWLNERQQK